MQRLVVNDVGPTIEPAALQRIAQYFGTDPTFASYDEIAAYVRTISAPFELLTEAQWEHVVRTNVRQRDDGRWVIGYMVRSSQFFGPDSREYPDFAYHDRT